jgi:hypothetical protein
MTTNDITPSAVYAKFLSGANLSDAELDVGYKHFLVMAPLLTRSGPQFQLAACEANRVLDKLEGYREARKRTKHWPA